MNTIDKQYQALLQDILDNGCIKKDRTGTGTISVFGRQIRHRMSDGFPLLTTKKMHWKSIVTELLWFLRGDTNIKYLVDNGCHIWDGDAYKNYVKKSSEEHVIETHKDVKDGFIHPELITQVILSKKEFIERIKTDPKFAAKWGELGPIYGKQWRTWRTIDDSEMKIHTYEIDQIADAIHKLKTNPDDRGIIVSAWNVGELDQMVLRPCHNFFQFYTRELNLEERMKLAGYEDVGGIGQNIIREQVELDNTIPRRAISLMYNARSQDVPLGTPFNIASYALLLEIIAKEVNMAPDELIVNMGDCHIYLNQKEGVVEQLTREPYPLPKLKILDSKVDDIAHYEIGDFIIEGYQSHPAIKIPLSN